VRFISDMTRKQRKMLLRILLAAALTLLLGFVPAQGTLGLLLYLIPYLIAGYDILYDAFRGLCNKQLLDENFLMAVATVGALVLGTLETGDYVEAVAVMVFYQTGELFQSYAVGKSRRSISALMDIRPDYANIEQDGKLLRCDPEEVEVGTVILVQPGEKIPIDGIVEEGNSVLDTAALTGESVPRQIGVGDECISGCINLTGVLKLRTTKAFEESTVSKILELVENAGANKSRSEKFISRFARIYTPAVCISALALAVLPPVVSSLMGGDPMFSRWLYRALTFLVASCPCALVISIPLSFFAGIGGVGKMGVLVKGANYLEALAKVQTVVLDKTGTLTQGVFEVAKVYSEKETPQRLIELAAHAEIATSHPIGKSLQRAFDGELDRHRVADVQQHSGSGITAAVDGISVAVGNARLMTQLGIPYTSCADAGTLVYVALDGQFAGTIVIADLVKPTASRTIAQLQNVGVKRCVMLTGDNREAALQIADALNITEVHSDLLPGDKVTVVEQLLSQKADRSTLAFVGDGVNDAPVLSRADVGIAMGAMGSDAAIEAADVVLMDDDPLKLVAAVRIAKKCVAIVRQNIVFAIAVKLLSLVLVAVGAAGMWLAIFADVGVMVLAVLNAIRAMFYKA